MFNVLCRACTGITDRNISHHTRVVGSIVTSIRIFIIDLGQSRITFVFLITRNRSFTIDDDTSPVTGLGIILIGSENNRFIFRSVSIDFSTLRYKKIITKPLASFNRSTSRNRQFSSIFNHYNTTQDIFLCFESFFSC